MYEYKFVSLGTSQKVEDQINRLAREGFRLVAVVPEGESVNAHAIMERELHPDEVIELAQPSQFPVAPVPGAAK